MKQLWVLLLLLFFSSITSHAQNSHKLNSREDLDALDKEVIRLYYAGKYTEAIKVADYKPVYCKVIPQRNSYTLKIPYAEYVSTLKRNRNNNGEPPYIYSVENIADERFIKNQNMRPYLCNSTRLKKNRAQRIRTMNNFRVIVESSNFRKNSDMPVLSSANVCSNSPTIYLIGTDQLYKDGGRYFSRKFYESESVIPKNKSDLGSIYKNLLNGVGSFNKAKNNYFNVLPHQFYARTNFVDLMPKDPRSVRLNSGNLPDATESGIVRSLQAIYKQCQKLPDVVNIEGIMNVRYYDSGWSNMLKTFFKGKYTPNDDEFKIVPDTEYQEISRLFSNIYKDSEKNRKALYARMRGRKKSNPTATAIAGAIFLGIIGIEIMNNHEKCRDDPFCQ
jgi:hypothetical protein